MANTGSSPLTSWRKLRKNLNVAADVLDRALKRGRSGSLAHFEALAYLAESDVPALPQSEIQAGLGLSQSATSRMLSRLESSGLVQRVLSKQDGRAWLIELTPAGFNAINSDLKEFVPLFRIQIHNFAKSLLPFNAVGAASLLLSEATAADDLPPTEGLLQVGEAILTLDQNPSFISQAMVIREALEYQVMLDAAQFRTEDDIEAFENLLLEMQSRLHDPAKFLQTSWQLLRRLLEISQNELLKELYSGLLVLLEQHFKTVVPTNELEAHLANRLDATRQLVDAVAKGDPEEIHSATERHLFLSRVRALGD